MQMHTGNQKDNVSLANEFQYNLKNITAKMVSLIKENQKKGSWKENGYTDSIMFRRVLTFNKKMWECIVTQLNSQNYHFVVHILNLIAQGGWVSIIICVLVQN